MMTKKLSLSVRDLNGDRFFQEARFEATQDSSFLLKKINQLYGQMPAKTRPIKVSVVLADFVLEQEQQLSLFGNNPKTQKAFKVVDAINARYGKNTIYVGALHETLEAAPTRIAFQRIPGLDEVDES